MAGFIPEARERYLVVHSALLRYSAPRCAPPRCRQTKIAGSRHRCCWHFWRCCHRCGRTGRGRPADRRGLNSAPGCLVALSAVQNKPKTMRCSQFFVLLNLVAYYQYRSIFSSFIRFERRAILMNAPREKIILSQFFFAIIDFFLNILITYNASYSKVNFLQS